LGGQGKITQEIRYANIVAHSILKILSYADRREGKDAHDLVYCLQHADAGIAAIAAQFREALSGKHVETIKETLHLMRARFATDLDTDGVDKDGPIAVANFEIAGDATDARDRRVLRRREAVTVIETLLKEIELSS
jgi:hypothetical protein